MTASAASALLNPPTVAGESLVDDLVGLMRGVIAARRDVNCGGLKITLDQERELANGLASNVLAVFALTRLDQDERRCPGWCGSKPCVCPL